MKSPIQSAGGAVPKVKFGGKVNLTPQPYKVFYFEKDAAVAVEMRRLETHIHNLYNMTEIMAELVFETFQEVDAKPSDEDCDRALFTVNDVQTRVNELKAAYFEALKAGDVVVPNQGVSPELIAIVDEVERTHQAWMESVPPHVDLPTNEQSEAYDKAQDKLINFPCKSVADQQYKIHYLHDGKTEASITTYHAFAGGDFASDFLKSLIIGEA